MEYSVNGLIGRGSFACACGRVHGARLKKAIIEKGALLSLPAEIKALGGKKAYIIADENTMKAAGCRAEELLSSAGIPFSECIYSAERIEPDERAVGKAVLHFDYSCDIIVAVGSGVINDISKIVARQTGLPFIVVGTAPSMDGYASSTSSVIRDSLKVSVDSHCPDIVIGDLDVLCAAPLIMIQSGLGDMLAKYVSVCEWRIGSAVTGEYYCGEVASIIRSALGKCVDGAAGIPSRNPESIKSIMEGMVISGIAADYAGVSRPVSGVEHYFSHVWDMRALEFGCDFSLHGIQCGIGTLYALKGYEVIKKTLPSAEKGLRHFDSFDFEKWYGELGAFIGSAAKTMIKAARSGKANDRAELEKRLENIVSRYGTIIEIIKEELPPYDTVRDVLLSAGAPVKPEDIKIDPEIIGKTYLATRDVRDKYILSSLAFDMGITDEIAKYICGGD